MSTVQDTSPELCRSAAMVPEIPLIQPQSQPTQEPQYPWEEVLHYTGVEARFDSTVEGDLAAIIVAEGCKVVDRGMITPHQQRIEEDGTKVISFTIDADSVVTVYHRGIKAFKEMQFSELMPGTEKIQAEVFNDGLQADEYIMGCISHGFYPEVIHIGATTIVAGTIHQLSGVSQEELIQSGRQALKERAKREGKLHAFAL